MILYWATAGQDISKWQQPSEGSEIDKYQLNLFHTHEDAFTAYSLHDSNQYPIISVNVTGNIDSLSCSSTQVSVFAWEMEYFKGALNPQQKQKIIDTLKSAKATKIEYDKFLLHQDLEKANTHLSELNKSLVDVEEHHTQKLKQQTLAVELEKQLLLTQLEQADKQNRVAISNVEALTATKSQLENHLKKLHNELLAEREARQKDKEAMSLTRATLAKQAKTLDFLQQELISLLKVPETEHSEVNSSIESDQMNESASGASIEESQQSETLSQPAKISKNNLLKEGIKATFALGSGALFWYFGGIDMTTQLIGQSITTSPISGLNVVIPTLFSGLTYLGIQAGDAGMKKIYPHQHEARIDPSTVDSLSQRRKKLSQRQRKNEPNEPNELNKLKELLETPKEKQISLDMDNFAENILPASRPHVTKTRKTQATTPTHLQQESTSKIQTTTPSKSRVKKKNTV